VPLAESGAPAARLIVATRRAGAGQRPDVFRDGRDGGYTDASLGLVAVRRVEVLDHGISQQAVAAANIALRRARAPVGGGIMDNVRHRRRLLRVAAAAVIAGNWPWVMSSQFRQRSRPEELQSAQLQYSSPAAS
jgi:hypothetical protein